MVKVAVLGAAGGIGQPLSLLLKMNPYVSQLALYDIRLAPGVATDLSHVNTNARCRGYSKDELNAAVSGAKLVVIPAGVPRKPGMTRDELFRVNAGIVAQLVTAVAQNAPQARILIISNPVNSTVPVAVETLRALGALSPGKVMGVTTLDVVRAQTFLSESLGAANYARDGMRRHVTVVGGHSGKTIVPLVLNNTYRARLIAADAKAAKRGGKAANGYAAFVHRVQFGGDEVVEAKQGAGSATLSMALAGYRFAEQVLKSIHSEATEGPVPCFVHLPSIAGGSELQERLAALSGRESRSIEYFAAPVRLEHGEAKHVECAWLDAVHKEEQALLVTAIADLEANVVKGKRFVQSKM
ncbi:LAMI_0G16490g1_1 [Lachancea mirantina]|uniref:Malate dehydrogenase n=1 Tax=Lachancea mirantina TaxID=1230905 RepID=A0A1G4KCZ5_9SACH|nr:LAMI_0G16490g1_1 [Lachancea mirantina]